MSNFRLAIVLLIAELWFCHLKLECSANFTECYNTTTETHCFSKIVNGPVNFYEAQKRCNAIDATLPVIKDDKVQTLLKMFVSNLSKSGDVEEISFYWTNANRIVDANWRWLNSSVINELSANISLTNPTGVSFLTYVASLALQNGSQQEVILTASNPAENIRYICEFVGDDCQHYNGDALRYGDKCYVAFEQTATWFDARDRCIGLEESGDLASFGDLRNAGINFTQWLDLSSAKQYWVGVRHLWWMWGKPDNSEVRYTSWVKGYPVTLYITDECVIVKANLGVAAEINGWQTENCTSPIIKSVGVICHKVTSFDLPTDSTSSNSYCPRCASTLKASTTDSTAIPLGVGIGLGLGIPIVIAIIVVIIVCVRRKRKAHQNVATATKNTDDPQIDQTQHGKDDTTTGGVYWEVTKNDSAASATDEGRQVPASTESDAMSGDKIVYSSVAFIEGGESQDDLN